MIILNSTHYIFIFMNFCYTFMYAEINRQLIFTFHIYFYLFKFHNYETY